VRHSRRVFRLAGGLALTGLFVAASASGATKTATIRPQETAAATHVDNAANATDDNDATFAAMSLSRVCRDDHQQPWRGTLLVDKFPGGYRPSRLEVNWTAWSVFAVMQDNKASVSATVEYTTGETWHRLESATWTSSSQNCPLMSDGRLTCLNHSVGVDLPAGLDSARMRVRVTLTAAFSECEASGMSGVANLVGHAKIYDVRMIAEKAPIKPAGSARAKKARPKTP
jgi:hypothetical protein